MQIVNNVRFFFKWLLLTDLQVSVLSNNELIDLVLKVHSVSLRSVASLGRAHAESSASMVSSCGSIDTTSGDSATDLVLNILTTALDDIAWRNCCTTRDCILLRKVCH